MNIPLIQKPETNDINASLIAIKKAEQQLNSLIEDLKKKLPTPPTTDGTYNLRCIVSGGVASYSWS